MSQLNPKTDLTYQPDYRHNLPGRELFPFEGSANLFILRGPFCEGLSINSFALRTSSKSPSTYAVDAVVQRSCDTNKQLFTLECIVRGHFAVKIHFDDPNTKKRRWGEVMKNKNKVPQHHSARLFREDWHFQTWGGSLQIYVVAFGAEITHKIKTFAQSGLKDVKIWGCRLELLLFAFWLSIPFSILMLILISDLCVSADTEY